MSKIRWFFIAVLVSPLVIAQDEAEVKSEEIVDDTIAYQVSASNLSVNAQKKVESLDEEAKKLYYEYKDTLAEYKGLKTYDDQLEQIIFAQEDEIENIIKQIDSLDATNKDILPFLKRMIDALRAYIDLDIPFLLNERTNRVDNLDDILLRSNVTTAEKFRKVFEAYQIEHNFGNTIETYDDIMKVDNNEVAVSFFRLGRLGYFYKTPDGSKSGYWNKEINSWVHMGSKLSDEIDAAIKIAKRQSPPNFINLPLKPLN